MGMLLDPLADKLLIAAAFVTLVQINPHIVPAWIVVVVIGREFLVSGLRSIAATQGFTIEASDLGKFKTVVQIVVVVAAILEVRWHEWDFGLFFFPVTVIARSACGSWSLCRWSRLSITLRGSGRRLTSRYRGGNGGVLWCSAGVEKTTCCQRSCNCVGAGL